MIRSERAEEVYSHIQDKLKGNEGKFIAIEPESGDYFIGATLLEAYEKGKTKFPGRGFFYKRIGFKAAFLVGAAK